MPTHVWYVTHRIVSRYSPNSTGSLQTTAVSTPTRRQYHTMSPSACVHVNPPSLVRSDSLRHFGIAENLRPGDENLRHLTVTSRFKIIASFVQSIVKTQPNFHAFSTFCFSQRSMVGEIIRVSSRPTFHAVVTRTRKHDISETDVSSKKMNIQKKSDRYLTKPDTIARSSNSCRPP